MDCVFCIVQSIHEMALSYATRRIILYSEHCSVVVDYT